MNRSGNPLSGGSAAVYLICQEHVVQGLGDGYRPPDRAMVDPVVRVEAVGHHIHGGGCPAWLHAIGCQSLHSVTAGIHSGAAHARS
jgi:hypothetical protein